MRHAQYERAIDEDRGLNPVSLLLAVAISGLMWWGIWKLIRGVIA